MVVSSRGDELRRLDDLLAEQATLGLDSREARELRRLHRRHPDVDVDGLDRTAAMLAVAIESQAPAEPAPPSLRDRLDDAALHWLSRQRGLKLREAGGRSSTPPAWVPWLVAAAAVIMTALFWWGPWGRQPSRQAILARADIRRAWADNESGVRGEVVWSNELQRGFMRFEGLQANDRRRAQYQLWIFDATRDDRYPVDGGVFDVTDPREATVPIRAKLPVGEPTLFAITVEPPGGVVVSDRSRLILAAPVDPG